MIKHNFRYSVRRAVIINEWVIVSIINDNAYDIPTLLKVAERLQ